ncbi:MAG: suppressor of fused domain protein [Clostridia bacterium]
MTTAHIVIMILFALAMGYYTIKWQKRRTDSPSAKQTAQGNLQQNHHPTGQTAGGQQVEILEETPVKVEGKEAASSSKEEQLVLSPAILNHYRSFFHTAGDPLSTERTEGIPIVQFPPAGKRGGWVTATCGLYREGGVELLIYSLQKETAIVNHLITIAQEARRIYRENGRGIREGDSFALDGPVVNGSQLSFMFAGYPRFEEEGFGHYTDGVDVVRFLMLHAITTHEHDYLNRNGLIALEALFMEKQANAIDFFRDPALDNDTLDKKD